MTHAILPAQHEFAADFQTFDAGQNDRSVKQFATENSYFTCAAYLEGLAFEKAHVISGMPGLEENGNLIFLQSGQKITCANRLARLSSQQVSDVCDILFARTDAEFIAFEDIELTKKTPLARQRLDFSFQENWKLELHDAQKFQSAKQASNRRRKERNLIKANAHKRVEFRFERTTDDLVDKVIELNRSTIENKGKTHSFELQQRERFKRICREYGYLAALYLGEQIIAGDIVTIIDDRAYFNVVGYDRHFEKFSPGAQVHHHALEECRKLGCNEANFLWGNSRWKPDFGAHRVPLITKVVLRNRMLILHPGFWYSTKPYFRSELTKTIKQFLLKS